MGKAGKEREWLGRKPEGSMSSIIKWWKGKKVVWIGESWKEVRLRCTYYAIELLRSIWNRPKTPATAAWWLVESVPPLWFMCLLLSDSSCSLTMYKCSKKLGSMSQMMSKIPCFRWQVHLHNASITGSFYTRLRQPAHWRQHHYVTQTQLIRPSHS